MLFPLCERADRVHAELRVSEAAAATARPGFAANVYAFMKAILFSGLLALGAAANASTNAPVSEPAQSPPAVQAASTNPVPGFIVKKGFHLEKVADESLVEDPGAMAFDESGRLFVVEMRDFPGGSDATPHVGRVRLLEDTNGDGTFDTSSVYADNLALPSAIACFDGGVFVASAPDILYLKDTRGDGVADMRKTVLTGFSTTVDNSRPSRPNNFTWGFDNKIHAASGGLDGVVGPPGTNAPVVAIKNADFAFNASTLEVTVEIGGADSGVTFDAVGRRYASEFNRPLRLELGRPEDPDAIRFFPVAPPFREVVSAATPLLQFRKEPLEEKTAAGKTRGGSRPISLAAFTMAEGAAIYRGCAFPAAYYGGAFIPDPAAQVVHHAVLAAQGLNVFGLRSADETNSEFVVATNSWLRPVQVVNGPDGALYLAVMARESMTIGGLRLAGMAGAGIYRIAPDGFVEPKYPNLAKASVEELVTMLGSANAWGCETAARLLLERRDPKSVALLYESLNHSQLPLGRMRALAVLDSLGVLKESDLLLGLSDRSELVRLESLRIEAAHGLSGFVGANLANALSRLGADPSPLVRHELTCVLGNAALPDKAEVLATLALKDAGVPAVRAALINLAGDNAGVLFVLLAANDSFRSNPVGLQFLSDLAAAIGVGGALVNANAVIHFMANANFDAETSFKLLNAFDDGLRRSRSSIALADKNRVLTRYYAAARDAAMNEQAAVSARVAALGLLGRSFYTWHESGDLLLMLLRPNESGAVQSADLHALARQIDPAVMPSLLRRWPVLTPGLRQEAVAALLERIERSGPMLDALENGTLSWSEFPPLTIEFLRSHPDPTLQQRAARVLGADNRGARGAWVQQLVPALKLTPYPARGRQIFLYRCAQCHEFKGEGFAFGPDLASLRESREELLSSIMDPNAKIRAGWETHVLITSDGEVILGLERSRNANTLTFSAVGAEPVILPREYVPSDSQETWSLMPESVSAGFTLQDLADLMAYIGVPGR
jgi:putative membrane-bound dehydrogenase-like protein